MLKEYAASQHPGEPRRRWFSDDYFDIIVWLDDAAAIIGFQLCYAKLSHERALTWKRGEGFRHDAIDDGEASPLMNLTPVLTVDGMFPAEAVWCAFMAESGEMDGETRDFILGKLEEYRRGE